MNDLKQIIAHNIIKLRKEKNLTQIEFAQKLNYSDKAISKWERAESSPDLSVGWRKGAAGCEEDQKGEKQLQKSLIRCTIVPVSHMR